MARHATLALEKGKLVSNQTIQTITIAAIAVCFGLIVVSLARRGLLSFRYTIGWLVLLGIGAISSVLTPLVRPIAETIGTTEGVVVSAVAIAVLLAICVQLSISVSGLQAQIRRIAENVAIRDADRPPS